MYRSDLVRGARERTFIRSNSWLCVLYLGGDCYMSLRARAKKSVDAGDMAQHCIKHMRCISKLSLMNPKHAATTVILPFYRDECVHKCTATKSERKRRNKMYTSPFLHTNINKLRTYAYYMLLSSVLASYYSISIPYSCSMVWFHWCYKIISTITRFFQWNDILIPQSVWFNEREKYNFCICVYNFSVCVCIMFIVRVGADLCIIRNIAPHIF